MAKAKIAITVDRELLEALDDLIAQRRFPNRSQAIEISLAEKIERLNRSRLAEACARLDPAEEKRLAEEGLSDALEQWPAY